jgi:hypothetical protein
MAPRENYYISTTHSCQLPPKTNQELQKMIAWANFVPGYLKVKKDQVLKMFPRHTRTLKFIDKFPLSE